LNSGFTELKSKLGPILWQFAPTRKFDEANFAAFFSMLPGELDGLALKHAIEVRHESFVTAEFVKLARKHGAAIVLADSDKYPMIADATADFVYMRLQRTQEKVPTGYPPKVLAEWKARAEAYASGAVLSDLPMLDKAPAKKKREVFVYFISGAKLRAPAAATALIGMLGR